MQIWRIEQFHVKEWPKTRYGNFYDGDSYIVLHVRLILDPMVPRSFERLLLVQAYKKDPDNEQLSYDLHFWLGSDTSQDEAATAAYKTVELDDRAQISTQSVVVKLELMCLRRPWWSARAISRGRRVRVRSVPLLLP